MTVSTDESLNIDDYLDYTTRWMSPTDAQELFNIDKKAIYMSHRLSNQHIREDLFIDIGYFIAYKQERKRLWLVAHDYYFFITERLTDSRLSLLLANSSSYNEGSWRDFFSNKLFMLVDDMSILDTRVSKRLIYFIEWFESKVDALTSRIYNEN